MNPTGRLINHRIAADGDLLDEFSTQPQGIGVQRCSKPKGTLYIENSAEMNYHVAFRLGGRANCSIMARRGDVSRSTFASENIKKLI